MDCILYIDLFFLWNFWMNGLVILLVRQITKTYRTLRCLLAAALGALGACFSVIFYVRTEVVVWVLLFEVCIIMVMGILAFGKNNLLWHLMLLILTGTMTAGSYLYISSMAGAGTDMVSVGVVSICALFFCVVLEKKSRVRWKEEHMKAKTVLEFGDRKLFATALLDTGNKLYDPIFRKPVILVDEKMMGELLELCKTEFPQKLHFIPFHSVGKENGLLEGLAFDNVSIRWQEKQYKFENVIAASTKESLYKGKEYQVIFHCGLLQEG